MWPSCVTIFYWSSDLSFLTSGWCHWSVLTSDCGIWISSTSYSGFGLSLVRLIAWTEDTYIGLTSRLFLVSTTFLDTVYCEAHSLQVMRIQLETLGEEFKLAGNIWWREPTMFWTWTLRCIDIVKAMIIFGHLICLRVLWWDVSVLWGQYLHHRHRGLWIIHLILWCALSFLRWLWLSLWGRHCFETTLIFIVDWLIQLYRWSLSTTVIANPQCRSKSCQTMSSS